MSVTLAKLKQTRPNSRPWLKDIAQLHVHVYMFVKLCSSWPCKPAGYTEQHYKFTILHIRAVPAWVSTFKCRIIINVFVVTSWPAWPSCTQTSLKNVLKTHIFHLIWNIWCQHFNLYEILQTLWKEIMQILGWKRNYWWVEWVHFKDWQFSSVFILSCLNQSWSSNCKWLKSNFL